MKTRNFFLLLTAVALAGLTACGGGGDAGPAAPAAAPVNTASALPSAAGSEDLAAFTLLNAEREHCGFGKLAQNAQLDAAAKAHADYQVINSVISHLEVSGKPGFTGASPTNRIAAAGYADAGANADEIAGFIGTSQKAGLGEPALRNL